MNPKVSVILTSYNKPQTVGKAIDSVLRQTMQEWELFIMDDASNEETAKVINKYLNDKRIHYCNSYVDDQDRYKKTRYAALINQAIPLTTGKYLSYLTDDTEYLPTRLKEMTNFLDRYSNIDIVYSGQMIQHVDNELKLVSMKTRKTKGVLKRAANRVDHCSVLHSRTIAEKVFRKYRSYWDDNPKYWHNGDAAFWSRLNEFEPFYPIHKVLDISYKTPSSFQKLNAFLPPKIPDGILVKGLGSEVYLIDQQKRRQIKDEMFDRLKYNHQKIVAVPDPVLFKYPCGDPIDESIFRNQTIPNQRLIKAEERADLFYLQGNQKRKILDQKAIRRFHFKLEELVHVNQEDIENIADGPHIHSTFSPKFILPDGVIYLEGSDYFLSYKNILHLIHIQVLKKLQFSEAEFVRMTKEERLLFEEGESLLFEIFRK
ncbi:glycosyltransferase family 2 protein [Halalkalibacter alkalisediminis]|uniref:Glycosyltransferase family 2 protein n=1 Tax=Halalkalibacter alkalisediminis TaxID=935616 RepID=A0ABV6NMS3_9BACI|nr:glycosyltransferase family 2 protein [Halalkalibacter alkalisediminis]